MSRKVYEGKTCQQYLPRKIRFLTHEHTNLARKSLSRVLYFTVIFALLVYVQVKMASENEWEKNMSLRCHYIVYILKSAVNGYLFN